MNRFFARTNDKGSGRRFARTNDSGIPIPTISSVTLSQRAGDNVVVTGTGFKATKGSATVTLGGVTCTTTAWSDTSITYTVPSTLMFTGTKTLTITNSDSQPVSRTGISFLPPTGYIFESITVVPVPSTSMASGVTGLAVGDEVYLNATAARVGGGGTATVAFIGDGTGNVSLSGVTVDGDYTISGINVKDVADGTSTSNGPKTITYDYTAPVGYAVDIVETTISDVTNNLINVNITGMEVGATYNYSITSSVSGTPITGSGIAAGASLSLTNINVSSLADGTIAFAFYMTDTTGLIGITVNDTCTKFTDRTANQFTFTPQVNVNLNTVVQSNFITVGGLTTGYNAAVTVTNGEWRKNGSSWGSSAGTVANGDTVEVRHTSSASFSTAVSTVFDINGVQNSFSSTTLAVDTAPTAFTFTPATNVALNSLTQSNSITVAGINSAAAVTITNGEWRKNGGSWGSTAGTVVVGDTVEVRTTSSASYNTPVNTTLVIGGVSGIFTVTTLQNNVPTQFTFTDQTGVPQNTQVISAPIIISGITVAVAISVTNGEYSIDNGPFTAVNSTINNNQTVRVRHTSSVFVETATNTVLTVGGVSDTFTSTTTQADSIPDAFTFTAQIDVPLNTLINSNLVTITGINVASAISIVNGEYSIDGAAFISSASTVNAGQTVRVRHNSSASYSTAVNTALTIGGVSATFTSTTLASVVDTTPNQFAFAAQFDVALNNTITSAPITVAGINAAATISILNGTYSIDNGPFVSLPSTVLNGQTVTVRHTSSFNYATAQSSQLTIGGVSATFTSTTLASTGPTPVEDTEYTEAELIQYMLDNNNNPPNTNFGVFTNALHIDSLLINYIANCALPTAITDTVQLNQIHSKLLRHYIAGNALRADNDTQNKTLGAEELALYEDEITKLTSATIRNQTPNDEHVSMYNPLG